MYDARPRLCRDFGGHYTGAMACSYNLDVPLKPVEDYFLGLLKESPNFVGQLGVDFNWNKGLIRP